MSLQMPSGRLGLDSALEFISSDRVQMNSPATRTIAEPHDPHLTVLLNGQVRAIRFLFNRPGRVLQP